MTHLQAVDASTVNLAAWRQLLDGWEPAGSTSHGPSYRHPGQTTGVTADLRDDGAGGLCLRMYVDYAGMESGYGYTLEQARQHLAPTPRERAAIADADLEHELQRLRVRRDARRLLDAEEGAAADLPTPTRLDAFLAVNDPDPEYRIDGLLPTGGNALLAAQHKAGKSTLVANLLRAVADGATFLERHTTRPATVTLVDNELDPRTLRRWLVDQTIDTTGAVSVVSLRGRVGSFDILNDQVRARWAAQLRGTDVLVFDCLRPALDALGLDENHDAGRFLIALDALKAEAGIDELIVVHHMGHGGERSRGDSRILDWPDAIWKILREKPDDPDSPRYFSAFGRDVDVHETRLEFDAATRRLRAEGNSRRMAAIDYACEAVVALLAEQGPQQGLTQHAIESALKESGIPRSDIREALHLLQKRGRTIVVPAARNAKLHMLLPQLASSPQLAASSPASTPTTSPPPL
ncbi:ATP-binding protein [Microbacterium caowuchunii]|uniref:AAA family ATPase n=1 Tax=Microbacterium caowuchunii TaxID=2614638 RepID=A0A5N0TJX0_9MICO|nr:AAA family ATPase [Microbacterium caowuchunii]KAA9134841.1 AAA family ATPase [Microbacterium caowuchunii]